MGRPLRCTTAVRRTLQEAFAAFLDHTDDQIGRFVDGLRDIDELDNTISSCSPTTALHRRSSRDLARVPPLQRPHQPAEEAVERIDDIGRPGNHTNYPWEWAQCATRRSAGTRR